MMKASIDLIEGQIETLQISIVSLQKEDERNNDNGNYDAIESIKKTIREYDQGLIRLYSF